MASPMASLHARKFASYSADMMNLLLGGGRNLSKKKRVHKKAAPKRHGINKKRG